MINCSPGVTGAHVGKSFDIFAKSGDGSHSGKINAVHCDEMFEVDALNEFKLAANVPREQDFFQP